MSPHTGVGRLLWAYGAVLVLAGVQVLVLGDGARIALGALPYAYALLAVLAVALATRRGITASPWLAAMALGGSVLSLWLVVAFLRALPDGTGEPGGFYVVKVAVTSPVGDHNTAAGLLLVALVAALALAAGDRRWWVAAGLVALGLVATLSRGAAVIVVLATGAALVASRRGRVRATTAAGLAVAAVVATAGVLVSAVVLDAAPPVPAAARSPGADVSGAGAAAEAHRADESGSGDGGAEVPAGLLGASLRARVDLAVRGVALWRDHPLLGVGLGGFGEHAADLPPPNDHAHQLLAHAAAEGGVILLAVAVALPILLVVRARRLPPGGLRETALLGGGMLVAHAQLDILGGRAGYEVLLAVLLALVSVHAVTGLGTRPEPGTRGDAETGAYDRDSTPEGER